MIKKSVFALALAFVAVALTAEFSRFAQSLEAQTIPHPGQFYNTIQTVPGPIPTSPTNVYTGNAYICYADITNNGQTITIQDQQPTPVVWVTGTSGSSGAPVMWPWTAPTDATCRYMPGGITWSAGGAGATGYLIIKYNK